jgi:hypothetical protein
MKLLAVVIVRVSGTKAHDHIVTARGEIMQLYSHGPVTSGAIAGAPAGLPARIGTPLRISERLRPMLNVPPGDFAMLSTSA